MAELIAEQRVNPTPRVDRETALSFDRGDLATGQGRSIAEPSGELFRNWLELTAGGNKPTLIRASKATNQKYLDARGITKMIS